MTKRIIMFNKRKNYGVMGTPTNVRGVYVGDIVSCLFKEEIVSGVITQDPYSGKFYKMGLWGIPLHDLDKLTIVIPHSDVSEDVLGSLHNSFTIETPIKMTKHEIEQELGYLIDVIEEKEE